MTITKALGDVELKEDGDKGLVTAVFSTFDAIDLDGDVTRKGAFTDGAPVVISAYGHRSWDGELPIGAGVIRERAKDAVMEGEFFLDTGHGRDAWGAVRRLSKAGLQEWSYSLENVTAEDGEVDGQKVRVIKRVDVTEVSPVLKGAGVNTRTLTIKSGAMKFADHSDAVVTALDEVVERALEVVTLRAAEGKSYTSVAELVEQVTAKAAEFRRRFDEVVTPPIDLEAALANELAQFYAFDSGVNP